MQDKLAAKLAVMYERGPPGMKSIIKVAVAAVGRGGEGEVGQRIRDDFSVYSHAMALRSAS